jgi:hypothetical protein
MTRRGAQNTEVHSAQWPVAANLKVALRYLSHKYVERILWIDAICIYSYRTAMKRLGNLRFMPQFSEGFHFVSERKKSYSVLPRCTLHIPRSVLHSLPFSFQERERGRFNRTRDGASGEPRQSRGGAPGEHARALGEPHGALSDANPQKPVRAQGAPLGLGYSCQLYPSFVSAKPAA